MDCWLEGVRLASTSRPPHPVLPYVLSVLENCKVAASELDRLAPLGKIHEYRDGLYPADLCVCPSHLIAKRDKVTVVHDWPNRHYPLNSALVNPPAEYGAMDGFLESSTPGGFMEGIDLQDCFLRWLAPSSCRRYLGVRRPVSGVLGAYLFLPFGLGPSPD